jgi:hypothetical protein
MFKDPLASRKADEGSPAAFIASNNARITKQFNADTILPCSSVVNGDKFNLQRIDSLETLYRSGQTLQCFQESTMPPELCMPTYGQRAVVGGQENSRTGDNVKDY